jgi:endonuclease-3 related protein
VFKQADSWDASLVDEPTLANRLGFRYPSVMATTAQTLLGMYRAMRRRLGHQGWWPGQGQLEICVGAILTQNTAWTNVEKAIANLRAAGAMSVAELEALSAQRLAELIRPAGYFNVKARRLKHFIHHVHSRRGEDIAGFLDGPAGVLREELLSINGIGRETADSIILYAAGKATFVVDAYTFRILFRHCLIGPEDGYESVKALMESSLPQDVGLWNDYHAQLVAVGKTYCRPVARCEGCPLESFPHDATRKADEF